MFMKKDYFWQASVEELKAGYYFDQGAFYCLICGAYFEEGIIYPQEEKLYTAERAVQAHICSEHSSPFDYYLKMSKVYTSLTEHQKALMKLFYAGKTDKEIAEITGATNTSTIRHQRFVMKEKYKQAKIIVAMAELLEEKKQARKNQEDELIEVHRTATMLDARYAITKAEEDEVLARYFDEENRLLIKNFPVKEKKKVIILKHLTKQFERNRAYTEKEVNEVIKRFYEDFSTVRRYLVQYGFLDRTKDGSAYWLKN